MAKKRCIEILKITLILYLTIILDNKIISFIGQINEHKDSI